MSPLTLLGTGNYVSAGTANHPTDTYSLSFSGAGLTTLLTAINNHATLRLVVATDAGATVATYTGATNTTFAGPTLSMDATVVPEPASLMLIAVGLLGLTAPRKRKRRSSLPRSRTLV